MAIQLRLDKYLADMGTGTRSEIKAWIRKGRVMVNGECCNKPETKIILNKDIVLLDNNKIEFIENIYYMMNKPAGVVSATVDNLNDTVLNLIKEQDRKGRKLFPVGRLDKDTEGLLIITNDGELTHKLLSPRKHVDKTYFALVKGRVTDDDTKVFLEGVDIGDDRITLPARLNILSSDDISEIELTIVEGRFHQVKRMFSSVGKEVIYLKRISMGNLRLDNMLLPGEYRMLSDNEINNLKNINCD